MRLGSSDVVGSRRTSDAKEGRVLPRGDVRQEDGAQTIHTVAGLRTDPEVRGEATSRTR